MRIAVNAVYLKNPRSGFGRYLGGLLPALASEASRRRLGWEWTAWIPEDVAAPAWEGVRFVHVPGTGGLDRKSFLQRAVLGAESAGDRPDALWLPHAEFPDPAPAGFRYWLTVHDLLPYEFFQRKLAGDRRLPWTTVSLQGVREVRSIRKNLGRIDRVWTVSQTAARSLEAHALREDAARRKLRWAENGVDPGFHPRSEEETIATLTRYGLSWRGFLLDFGGSTARKNRAGVRKAYAALPAEIRRRFPLALTQAGEGPFPEGLRPLPPLTDEELQHLVASAAAVCYCTFGEGFGFPVLESLASGTKVLMSNLPVLREIAGLDTFAVDPFDPYAISDAMQTAFHLRKAGHPSPERAREYRERYTWARAAERLLTDAF